VNKGEARSGVLSAGPAQKVGDQHHETSLLRLHFNRQVPAEFISAQLSAYSVMTRTDDSDRTPHSTLAEHAPQEMRKVLRSLTARAAILPAVVLGNTESTEITATDDATGELLDRICTRRLPDLRKFVRKYRGALITLHVWCRPVAAERVKALLGAPALYHSAGSAGRLLVCYPVAGAAAREIIVPAHDEIYAWAGHTVDFRGGPRTREIVSDTLLVVTVRPDSPRTVWPPPARGGTPQLPIAL
jgi:hypothetical protein